MAKDPAFLFYTGDFSTGTQFFTDEQVGKYIRLLLAQHQCGHLHEKHMIQICKTHDKDIFDKFIQDENGLYYNQRLENEVVKRRSYSESRADNRRKNKDTSSTYVSHMENENKDVSNKASNTNSVSQKLKIEEDMIVLEMIKIWKKYNPAYLEDKESDYTACLQMAYKIARIKGWKEGDVINFRELDAVMSWGKIMAFVSLDAFLKNLPLKSLNNNFQMVVQKMQGQQSDAKKDEIKKPPQQKMTEAQKQKVMEEWANS